jgi:hypothetical protein
MGNGYEVCTLQRFYSMCRAVQDHIYTVYMQYFWQENHQIYGKYCIYTILANPKYVSSTTGAAFLCAFASVHVHLKDDLSLPCIQHV